MQVIKTKIKLIIESAYRSIFKIVKVKRISKRLLGDRLGLHPDEAAGFESKQIWVFGCGGNRWGDNAAAFYTYVSENQPEIFAVRSLKSSINVTEADPHTVIHGSINNCLAVAAADVILFTHSKLDIAPRHAVLASHARLVWLKHGVTGIKMHNDAPNKYGDIDLVVACTEKEKALISSFRNVGNEKIVVTGYPRHDSLLSLTKSPEHSGLIKILFAPTFRDCGYNQELQTKLLEWIDLLEKRIDQTKKLVVHVWAHTSWKDDLKLNHLSTLSTVELIENQDIQQHLADSDFFITDYSSILFDACIAGVTSLIYQPDFTNYVLDRGLFSDFIEISDRFGFRSANALTDKLARLVECPHTRDVWNKDFSAAIVGDHFLPRRRASPLLFDAIANND